MFNGLKQYAVILHRSKGRKFKMVLRNENQVASRLSHCRFWSRTGLLPCLHSRDCLHFLLLEADGEASSGLFVPLPISVFVSIKEPFDYWPQQIIPCLKTQSYLQIYFCPVREHLTVSGAKAADLFGNLYLESHHDFVSEYY